MDVVELDEPFPFALVERSTSKPHVGEIIHDMLIDLGVQKRGSDADPYQFEKGFMWERLLSMALPGTAVRIGEIELDGIVMSPDGIGYRDDLGESVVEEYKCTAKREDNCDPSDNVGWMMQTKAYCKGMGLTSVIFRILSINKPWCPVPKVYLVTFSQGELDANWSAIVAYAKDRGLI
jgi:hypothetical protein